MGKRGIDLDLGAFIEFKNGDITRLYFNFSDIADRLQSVFVLHDQATSKN